MNDHTTEYQNLPSGVLPDPQALGGRIRQFRTQRGLSQEALAEQLDVSRQAVAKWERGASLPSTANLLALSSVFGISLPELTGAPDAAGPVTGGPEAAPGEEAKKDRRPLPFPVVLGGFVLLLLAAAACLAGAVGTLLVCLIQPAVPEGIIGYADSATGIWVTGTNPFELLVGVAGILLAVVFLACAILLWRRRR